MYRQHVDRVHPHCILGCNTTIFTGLMVEQNVPLFTNFLSRSTRHSSPPVAHVRGGVVSTAFGLQVLHPRIKRIKTVNLNLLGTQCPILYPVMMYDSLQYNPILQVCPRHSTPNDQNDWTSLPCGQVDVT